MNTVWSEQIQSSDCLYTSRRLRFSDRVREKYVPFFAIPENATVLEIGCGPGALCETLTRWYPKVTVHGVDRDSSFIAYARKHVPTASFSEEDITALTFAEASFDVTISNTVSEHVAPDAFFREQYRVLKSGGVCLVLSARRGIQRLAPCVGAQSEFETEIWERVAARCAEIDSELGIGAYSMTEQELPLSMEKYGFRRVSVEYITNHLTPDDPKNDGETARDIIESERASSLSAVVRLKNRASDLVTDAELQTLSSLINRKFYTRLALYEKGEKQWDTYVSLTMVVRGEK